MKGISSILQKKNSNFYVKNSYFCLLIFVTLKGVFFLHRKLDPNLITTLTQKKGQALSLRTGIPL